MHLSLFFFVTLSPPSSRFIIVKIHVMRCVFVWCREGDLTPTGRKINRVQYTDLSNFIHPLAPQGGRPGVFGRPSLRIIQFVRDMLIRGKEGKPSRVVQFKNPISDNRSRPGPGLSARAKFIGFQLELKSGPRGCTHYCRVTNAPPSSSSSSWHWFEKHPLRNNRG